MLRITMAVAMVAMKAFTMAFHVASWRLNQIK
jgi:hypothetical protein